MPPPPLLVSSHTYARAAAARLRCRQCVPHRRGPVQTHARCTVSRTLPHLPLTFLFQVPADTTGLFAPTVRFYFPDGSDSFVPAAAALSTMVARGGAVLAVQRVRASFELAWVRATLTAPGPTAPAGIGSAGVAAGSGIVCLKCEYSSARKATYIAEVYFLLSKPGVLWDDATVNVVTGAPETGWSSPPPDYAVFPTKVSVPCGGAVALVTWRCRGSLQRMTRTLPQGTVRIPREVNCN